MKKFFSAFGAAVLITVSQVGIPVVSANTALVKSQQAVAAAERKVAQAKGVLDESNRQIALIQPQYDAQKQRLTVAENKMKSIPTIKLTPEYVSALKSYFRASNTAEFQRAEAELKSESSRLKNSVQYLSNIDDEYPIDVNNLTEAQLLEVSFYAQTLINQIRAQMGTTPVSVSKGAVQFADLVTDGYVRDGWQEAEHHSVWINESARRMGMQYDRSSQRYENLFGTIRESNILTMKEAKEYVFTSIIKFLFNEYEWYHATSIAGISWDTRYVGVDTSMRGQHINVHFMMVAETDILPGSPFDKSVLSNPYESGALRTSYQEALTAYQMIEPIYRQRLVEKTQAQSQYDQATRELAEAKRVLSMAQSQGKQQIPLASSTEGQRPVYRLYHEGLKVHLYTTDTNERNVLQGRGWRYEDVAWKTSTKTGKPVYRLYHEGLRVHLYTQDDYEALVLATRGWRNEGVAYRSHGSVKIYRLYHEGLRVHLYTRDANEYRVLGTRGWRQENVAWYSE